LLGGRLETRQEVGVEVNKTNNDNDKNVNRAKDQYDSNYMANPANHIPKGVFKLSHLHTNISTVDRYDFILPCGQDEDAGTGLYVGSDFTVSFARWSSRDKARSRSRSKQNQQ
jgi:hypothetical protein